MTPLWLALLLPSVELAAAWRLRSKIAWRRYKALLAYLLTEAGWHLAAVFYYPIATRYAQPFRMGVRVWVLFDVFRFGCVHLSLWERLRLAGEAVTASATLAWLVSMCTSLSPLENFLIFRGYFHIMLAGAMWWLVLRLRKEWLAENRDHKGYRRGITRWFTILAIDGMFVKGGSGYWIFPFDTQVWWWANVVSYSLKIANVGWMAWWMSSNISCLRPDVAYRIPPQRETRSDSQRKAASSGEAE